MYYFCTYFDRRYLARGLALYESLSAHCAAFELWVLCMDDVAYTELAQRKLTNLHPIALAELEAADPDLLAVKAERTAIEYYFTCTPALPLHIFRRSMQVDAVTYLDADLFFFADPAPLFAELGTGSIAIIGHRFPPQLRCRVAYGIYNVGWITFRRDDNGLACLHWWRARCLEWCYDRVEAGRYADQKYLDRWPELFAGVVVLQHKGANLAPWNLANFALTLADRQVLVDEQPLVCFHFHGLQQLQPWLYHPHLADYKLGPPSALLRRQIYAPYIQTLRALALTAALPGGVRYQTDRPLLRVARALRNGLRLARDIILRRCLFVVGDRVVG